MHNSALLSARTCLSLRKPLVQASPVNLHYGALLSLLIAAVLSGCGSPGSPQPPSLKLPAPPTDLTAARIGDAVVLHWTMPTRASDRVPLSGDQRAVICRSLEGATPCTQAGAILLQPGISAAYTDALPASLLTGPPRLLTYTLLLENHRQRSAGPSNPAYTAAGAAPPPIAGLQVNTGPNGIVLHWQPATLIAAGQLPGAVEYRLRLQRSRIQAAGERPNRDGRTGVPQPLEQTLDLPEPRQRATPGTLAAGWTADHAIDQDAALNRTYRYTVDRIARLSLQGHAIEVDGPVSAAATVIAKDTFPPAVPSGLEAVADGEGGAIDLSWTADTDPDLAGYFVYRHIVQQNGQSTSLLARVSGGEPVTNAAWRDTAAQTGRLYAYSVSAVDTSGNESARSPEVEERLDAKTPAAAPASAPH